MPRSMRRRRSAPILVLALLAAGSPVAMSAEIRAFTPPPETYETRLPFATHSFAAYCYNTLSCSVVYNNRQFAPFATDTPRPAPKSADYRDNWSGGHLGIRNFPSAIVVKWISLDGVKHDATIDLAQVFPDALVWHKVRRSDMRHFYDGPVVPFGPEIVVEVNDRAVNVYTKMSVPTKIEQIPGKALSHFRADRFLAWTVID